MCVHVYLCVLNECIVLLRKRSLARLSEVLEIRNTSRACLRSLITQERSPERNGVKLVNYEENVTSERVPLHGAPLPKQI